MQRLFAQLFLPLLLVTAANAQEAPAKSGLLRLRIASFDPRAGVPETPSVWTADDRVRLWVVQCKAAPTAAVRSAIEQAGGQVLGYLPDNAYTVRCGEALDLRLARHSDVRWVGRYQPAWRVEPELLAELPHDPDGAFCRYHLVVADKQRDKPALSAAIRELGGRVTDEQRGSLLFTVELDAAQVFDVARLDQVLWIERWTAPEIDMDNARVQGGADHVEAMGGWTGSGVGAHVYEGIEATHPDFTGGAVNVHSAGGADNHGHATAGIVFGNGASNPVVRGMAPDASKFFTQFSTVSASRYQVVDDLVNIHEVSHTTASWGGGRVLFYTAESAETDDIIFDHDIAWTQSQSNAGNQMSRPQAWAKNVFSVGGVRHYDNSNPGDDSWSGGGSTGPAADGRIKPTLCAYFDSIGTSDRTGAAGYSASDWYSGFNGTSGATPIVAGHNVIAIQMFTDGIFGNALRNPGGSRHSNRPHFTTLKALQVANAEQYGFQASSADNRREHVGWGFPSLRRMYDNRNRSFLVDETDVLTQGQSSRWDIAVQPGESELKIVLHYSEPAANPAAAAALVNDLSIRVVSPTGVVYWGNEGLEQGNYSVAGSLEDDVNPIECVFVQNPVAGTWTVDVLARRVAVDSHRETPTVDADYGLAVVGGTGSPGTPQAFATFTTYGFGCRGSVPLPTICTQLNPGGGSLAGHVRSNEYCYAVGNAATLQVESFRLFTASTTGNVETVAAFLYGDASGQPTAGPVATTTIAVGPAPGFYTATFSPPVTISGPFYLGMDSSQQNVVVSQLTSGATGSGFFRTVPLTGSWIQSGLITAPAYQVHCVGGGQFAVPLVDHSGRPQLGSSYSVRVRDALAMAPCFSIAGYSDTVYQGTPLPAPIPGAPGCMILVEPILPMFGLIAPDGTAGITVPIPNDPQFMGQHICHQWVILDAVNQIGMVTSNGGKARVGF